MTYLEYLDIKVKELASVVPRISVWDSETVSQFEKLDLVSAEDGTYGEIPVSVFLYMMMSNTCFKILCLCVVPKLCFSFFFVCVIIS